MFGRHSRPTSRLRTCPVCHSDAIRGIEATELRDRARRLSIRCGGCDTWRVEVLEPRAAEELWRRFARSLERDHAQMVDALRCLESGGLLPADLAELRGTPPAHLF